MPGIGGWTSSIGAMRKRRRAPPRFRYQVRNRSISASTRCPAVSVSRSRSRRASSGTEVGDHGRATAALGVAQSALVFADAKSSRLPVGVVNSSAITFHKCSKPPTASSSCAAVSAWRRWIRTATMEHVSLMTVRPSQQTAAPDTPTDQNLTTLGTTRREPPTPSGDLKRCFSIQINISMALAGSLLPDLITPRRARPQRVDGRDQRRGDRPA